jgi:hypothetical protein
MQASLQGLPVREARLKTRSRPGSRDHVDLRFGMFRQFGIRTFTGGEGAEANQDIS